jgi:hypothetical protein
MAIQLEVAAWNGYFQEEGSFSQSWLAIASATYVLNEIVFPAWRSLQMWGEVNFGKWRDKGKTLPQVLVADPDWFFWVLVSTRN